MISYPPGIAIGDVPKEPARNAAWFTAVTAFVRSGAPARLAPFVSARGAELLASHDHGSLADLLQRSGAPRSTASAAAARVIRHVFRDAGAFSDAALAAIDVGAWARPTLLGLDASPALEIAVPKAPATVEGADTVRVVAVAR